MSTTLQPHYRTKRTYDLGGDVIVMPAHFIMRGDIIRFQNDRGDIVIVRVESIHNFRRHARALEGDTMIYGATVIIRKGRKVTKGKRCTYTDLPSNTSVKLIGRHDRYTLS